MGRPFHSVVRSTLFALIIIAIFSVQAAKAASGVEFFASRSFGGHNAMFYATSTGDFDGDGNQDVVTASYDKLFVYYGNGTGTFDRAPLTVYSYNSNTYVFPLAADFNSDGRSDLVFFRTNPQTSQPAIAVYFGNADKTFKVPVFSSPSPMPTDLKAVDMDQDGKLDLVGPAQASGNNLIVTYKGDLAGGFTVSEQANTGLAAGSVAPVDIDNDGKIDLAYGTSQDLRAVRNLGGGSYDAPVTIASVSFGFGSVRGADVNNDGKIDLIASQAVISGAFSLSWQAMRMGVCPRLLITHTSAHHQGQIYVPQINFLLRQMGVTTIVLTGIMTDCCVVSTAFEASNMNYRVITVNDLTAGTNEELEDAALKIMSLNTGLVLDADDVLEAWAGARRLHATA